MNTSYSDILSILVASNRESLTSQSLKSGTCAAKLEKISKLKDKSMEIKKIKEHTHVSREMGTPGDPPPPYEQTHRFIFNENGDQAHLKGTCKITI